MTVKKVLFMLVAAYPRQELTDETISLYERLLADMDPELLQAAALRHMGLSQWFPTIAELRKIAADMKLESSGVLVPELAWEVAVKDYRNAPPEVKRAVCNAFGDYYNMKRSTTPDLDRVRFLDAYTNLVEVKRQELIDLPDVRRALEPGRGNMQRIAERVNGSNGHE